MTATTRLLLEGTGDPAQADELVGLVEDNGIFYILNWLRDTPRESETVMRTFPTAAPSTAS